MTRKALAITCTAVVALIIMAGIAIAASAGGEAGSASTCGQCKGAVEAEQGNRLSLGDGGQAGQIRCEDCLQERKGECSGDCERLQEQLRERDCDGDCPQDGTGEQRRKGDTDGGSAGKASR